MECAEIAEARMQRSESLKFLRDLCGLFLLPYFFAFLKSSLTRKKSAKRTAAEGRKRRFFP